MIITEGSAWPSTLSLLIPVRAEPKYRTQGQVRAVIMAGSTPCYLSPSLIIPFLHAQTALSGPPDLRRLGKGPEIGNLAPGIGAPSLLVPESSRLPRTPPKVHPSHAASVFKSAVNHKHAVIHVCRECWVWSRLPTCSVTQLLDCLFVSCVNRAAHMNEPNSWHLPSVLHYSLLVLPVRKAGSCFSLS